MSATERLGDDTSRTAPRATITVPNDFVSKLKAAYREDGPQPSLSQYGWILES